MNLTRPKAVTGKLNLHNPGNTTANLDNPVGFRRTGKITDFRTLLGEDAWSRLTQNIRHRFSETAKSQPVYYTGRMELVQCSFTGKIFAQLARLIGTPLAPYSGRNIPTKVRVYDDPKTDGTVWERIYYFTAKRVITVRSTKLFTSGNHLLECVGGGIGMKLNVFEQNRSLHFKSSEYFWQFGGFQVRLPAWLTPGVAHVVHSDESNGKFRFTMTIRHPFLGVMFHQDGVFKEDNK